MTDRLTHKERGFVKDYIETGNGTKAALANYDTKDENTAAVIASTNIRKPKIQQAIEEALPDDLLNEVHREGLYATREYYNNKGEFMGDVADYSARAKYLDMALKRRGLYAPDKHMNVNIEVEPDETIRDLTQKLNDLYRGTN